MKKIILLLLLFCCGFVYSQSYNYKYNPDCGLWQVEGPVITNPSGPDYLFIWQFVQTSATTQLTSVVFKDTLKGWATHSGNGATRTTDGGSTWLPISFNDTNFTTTYNGVFFINPNTGWCVGGAVQIRKTTNGGANWFKQYAPPVAGVLNGVYFWDENTGIVIGRKTINYNSFIAKTTNSGNNWFEIVASTSNENELWSQYWFDANTGWICGRSILLKSTNGGLNYSNYYANVPPTQNGINALLSITFVNQQTGWIGGSNLEHQNIYKTTNGGLNWVFQTNPVVTYPYSQINAMKFLSVDSGWAIHGTPASGAIMFTTNGGTNWIIEEGSNNWFQCIDYFQLKKAWVGASGGKLWYAYLTPPTGIKKITNTIPDKFNLSQNYPNPFNPVTKIKFDVPSPLSFPNASIGNPIVMLKIYDILGRELQTLLNENLSPGMYEVTFDGSNLASGIYFYKLSINNEQLATRKMILLK
jgi:photosystem II stability/assembly factor-like uncharacterized protein